MARRVFLTPECCNAYRHNWYDLRRMVGYLRGAYAKNLGDPQWKGFVAELCSESESFASLWALNDVCGAGEPNEVGAEFGGGGVGDVFDEYVVAVGAECVDAGVYAGG